MFIVSDVADDLSSRAGVGPQSLLSPAAVPRDDGVGGLQDGLGGAVVLLQDDGARLRIVLLELDDVADRGPAEGVDRLIGVADHAQFRHRRALIGRADELFDQHVLRMVGVLIFIDQDVREASSVVLTHRWEGLQDVDGHRDDVVEVQGIG